MQRSSISATILSGLMRSLSVFLALFTVLSAADLDRDFSGNWILVEERSRVRGLNQPEPFLKVTQDARSIRCETDGASWSYYLDGRDSKFKVGAETRNAALKWEGSALLVNVLVSGESNY